jgi:hypothetical protein
MCSVCTRKGIKCLAPPPQQSRLPRRHLQGPLPHLLQGLSPRSADGFSRHGRMTTIGYAPRHTLWRGWSRCDWTPTSRALWYIRVVTLRILAIVPVRRGRSRRIRCLGGRLHIDRWGRDDNWWVVGIGLPVRPEGDDNAGPKEDMPVAMCIPWHRTRHEQCPHDPEDRQPLLACGSCPVHVVHSTSEKNSRAGRSSVRCAVDKRTQICDACIRASLRSVGVDLATCVLHPYHT